MASQLCYDPLSKEFELIMADALTLFVQAKIADSDLRLDRFLLDYFRKVKLGEHVFQRNYEFISGSDHNKKMFVSLFWKTYHHLAFTSEPLTEPDYYNLLLFLCPDIPRSLVAAAFMTIGLASEGKLYFSDFIYSFQLCFYFFNYINTFRETLKFSSDRIMTKAKVIDTASEVHTMLTSAATQSPANVLPPFSAVKAAFINVELFECWKSVQDCLVRSDEVNNAVGILPLRTTMTDHESLKALIPADWINRRHLQPTLLTLNTHASGAPGGIFDGGPSERSNGFSHSGGFKGNLSSLPASKLLKRPSKQFKLSTQTSLPREVDADMGFLSEQSSVAENSSSTGTTPAALSHHRPSLRAGTRARLPSIATIGPGAANSSMQNNLSSQVLDEQSSSEDERTSSVSSDADN